jgi:hypothetical protein
VVKLSLYLGARLASSVVRLSRTLEDKCEANPSQLDAENLIPENSSTI